MKLPAVEKVQGLATAIPGKDAAQGYHSARPLFFLKIPKTGGTSLAHFLCNRFQFSDCLVDVHRSQGATYDPNCYRLVIGEVGIDYAARFRARPLMVTCLREPLQRSVSAYYFYRRRDDAYYAARRGEFTAEEWADRVRVGNTFRDLSLSDVLNRELVLAEAHLGNLQTRRLAGRVTATPEDLNQACRNLERCEIVGLTERMDESTLLLCHQMGWEAGGPLPRENTGAPGRPKLADLDHGIIDALKSLTALDAELYRFAAELFATRLREMHRDVARPGGPVHSHQHLPDCEDFSFDRPIHGGGWNLRERVGTEWICWIGPRCQAWIDLRSCSDGPRVLQLRVAHAIRPAVLGSLQVHVNGHPVSLSQRREGNAVLAEGLVAADVLRARTGGVRIHFTVNETVRPCDVNPTSSDRRPLGIALSNIRLQRCPTSS